MHGPSEYSNRNSHGNADAVAHGHAYRHRYAYLNSDADSWLHAYTGTGLPHGAESLLLLKQNGGTHDKQLFKWVKGAALNLPELADPTDTTQYRVCIYSGATNNFLEGFRCPRRRNELEPNQRQRLQIQGPDRNERRTHQTSAHLHGGVSPSRGAARSTPAVGRRAEELRERWGTEPGQIWQLGEHRLHCGDATNAEDVAKLLAGATPLLMVTDPPYGVEYDPNWRNEAAAAGHISYAARATGKVANDDRADWSAAWAHFPGDILYIWHAGVKSAEVQTSLARSGFQVRAQIVWAKSHMVISRGHYHGQHEPCFYAVREKATSSWTGDRSQVTLWEISNQQSDHTIHSTQKPVECMRRPIANHGTKADAVYDPFCGSGTTIIACEQVGRRCFAMSRDLSPAPATLTGGRTKEPIAEAALSGSVKRS